MTMINVEYDTKEKKLAVSVDGKKMKDVANAEFFVFGDEASVSITTVTPNVDEDLNIITRLIANQDGELVSVVEDQNDDIESFAKLLE